MHRFKEYQLKRENYSFIIGFSFPSRFFFLIINNPQTPITQIGKNTAHDTKMNTPTVKTSVIPLNRTDNLLSLRRMIPDAHPPIYVRIKVALGS